MEEAAKLTIVIPVKNRAGIIKDTLDSVHKQRLRPLNVVLVDNGSTDNTLAVLKEWKEHCESPTFKITVVSENIPGAAAARNRGLSEVTTPYTMFFDSDDIMSPNHTRRAVEALDKGYDIVGWDVYMTRLNHKKSVHRFYIKNPMWHNILHGSLATQRYATRTELFRRVGGWNINDRGWDDIELGTRLLLQNPSMFKSEGEPTVHVICRVNSITGDAYSPSAERWENSLDLIEKSLVNAGQSADIVDLRRTHLAGLYLAEGNPEDAVRLLKQVRARYSGLKRRLFNFAFRYTSLGGRGLGFLLSPFFNK